MASDQGITIGSKLPPLRLPVTDGEPFALDALLGKASAVIFAMRAFT